MRSGDIKRAVYAGSFDVFTNGHLDVIRQGANLFDELIVAIGINPSKNRLFTIEESKEMILQVVNDKKLLKTSAMLTIDTFTNDFLVNYAVSHGCQYYIRGLRSEEDFKFENAMADMNRQIQAVQSSVPKVEPIWFPTNRELRNVSSSMVKGLVGIKGWELVVVDLVPPPVFVALTAKMFNWD
jgi:pantetheine-phosphate adenylyltransferase